MTNSPVEWRASTQPVEVLKNAASKVSGASGMAPVRFNVAPAWVAMTQAATLVAGPSPMKTALFGSMTLMLPGWLSGPAGTPGISAPIVPGSAITVRQLVQLAVA